MFKSKKKRQQQKAEAEAQAQAAIDAANELKKNDINKYKLDDINITHDFRSSVILPQLNKNLDLNQFHSLQQLDIASSSTLSFSSSSRNEKEEPASPTNVDGSKQYQDLAAWRHLRSQNRYSNGLFGGKQRGRPKPGAKTPNKNTYQKSPLSIDEEEVDSDNNQMDSFTPEEYNENENNEFIKERENNIILEEEPFEPDSDMEENYFFHDFSADALSNEKKSKMQNKKRRASAKSNKQVSLSSLARELNASRLSVIQPRDSRIVMTEEDEQELNKLLELQKQRMSVYTNDYSRSPSPTPSPSSPIPALPSLNKYDDNKQAGKRRSSAFDIRSLRKSSGIRENDINESSLQFTSEQARPINHVNNIASDNAIQSVTKKNIVSSSSNVSQFGYQQHGSTLSLANSLKRSVSVTSSLSNKPVLPETTSNYVQENENNYNTTKPHSIPGHRRSLSMDAMSVKLELDDSFDIEAWKWSRKNSIQTNDNKPETNNIIQSQSPHSLAGPLNKNNSYQYEKNGYNNYEEEEEYEEEVEEDEEVMVTGETVHKEQKSFGLFGGFRNANKSRSNSGSVSLKGFVRNLSSTNISASAKSERRSERGMSRAAATALQHNDANDDLNNNNNSIKHPAQLEEAIEDKPKTKKDRKRTASDNSRTSHSGGAVRLLSQLLSRSSKQKKIVKTINVEEKTASDTKKRAQVVRRTIIYVQPDSSLEFLKMAEDQNSGISTGNTNINVNEGYPPLPALNDGKVEINEGGLPLPSLASSNSSVSDGSTPLDDDTADSCALKTKQARQLSIKKHVDQSSDLSKPSHERLNFNEKYARYNSDNNDQSMNQMDGRRYNRVNSQTSRESHYMQGVELREMSDGSVVWGIVQKEGNRVSFFSPDNQNNTQYNYINNEMKEEEEEEVEYDRFSDFERESRTTYSSISESSKNYNAPAPIPHYCLQPPPPIPKRSSLRRSPTTNSNNRKQGNAQNISTPPPEEASTADIYYADDITLPNLLKLMRDQEKNTSDPSFEDEEESYLYQKAAIPSVDEQLEEMMRSLTTQERLNRA